jgi:hypothetical protein
VGEDIRREMERMRARTQEVMGRAEDAVRLVRQTLGRTRALLDAWPPGYASRLARPFPAPLRQGPSGTRKADTPEPPDALHQRLLAIAAQALTAAEALDASVCDLLPGELAHLPGALDAVSGRLGGDCERLSVGVDSQRARRRGCTRAPGRRPEPQDPRVRRKPGTAPPGATTRPARGCGSGWRRGAGGGRHGSDEDEKGIRPAGAARASSADSASLTGRPRAGRAPRAARPGPAGLAAPPAAGPPERWGRTPTAAPAPGRAAGRPTAL